MIYSCIYEVKILDINNLWYNLLRPLKLTDTVENIVTN